MYLYSIRFHDKVTQVLSDTSLATYKAGLLRYSRNDIQGGYVLRIPSAGLPEFKLLS